LIGSSAGALRTNGIVSFSDASTIWLTSAAGRFRSLDICATEVRQSVTPLVARLSRKAADPSPASGFSQMQTRFFTDYFILDAFMAIDRQKVTATFP
jgi:hypothetical protein